MRLAILIRVYNRINDLSANLKVIRELWKKFNNAFVIVAFNGKSDGYELPEIVFKYADKVLQYENNSGHLKGNSQLILESYNYIPEDTEFLVILEADTWLLDDSLISKYLNIMDNRDIAWCSSEWRNLTYSLGIDFAILNFNLLKGFYKDLFNFDKNPEEWVADFLIQKGLKFLYIRELMPVHIPKILSSFFRLKDRRLHIFLKGKMITHHIECLKNGIEDKYAIANCIINSHFFYTSVKKNCFIMKIFYFFLPYLLMVTPQSSWFKSKKHIFLRYI
ncbi:MAG: glycosyltransferase family 2 protein [Calditerrivibrio sp.]|uniref:glycosyltransferase family 2 protein n=1 Tax=Calditerrivibrio sp. TaxID=2792612 RepID=UPI003D0F1E1E